MAKAPKNDGNPAILHNAIRMFLTRLDAETITSMCDVDRVDLSTMVIKWEVGFFQRWIADWVKKTVKFATLLLLFCVMRSNFFLLGSMAEQLQLYVTLTELIYLLLLSNERLLFIDIKYRDFGSSSDVAWANSVEMCCLRESLAPCLTHFAWEIVERT